MDEDELRELEEIRLIVIDRWDSYTEAVSEYNLKLTSLTDRHIDHLEELQG